ncbi:hypothetical protein QFC21_002105 [Naganishia friedmannii]|uniref:Uncharacterized protein n=1 Tax=Naganishia friedmannii TaxID=89922 RepID=A0ACC2W0H5_9TREE|nr:hypothetical protein QFC21_002105 [Naganishia friedmannii]
MAQISGIVLEALAPHIVIFTDEQVDRSCQLNGCKSLDELFKPWQTAVERVPVLSSTLSATTHPSFAVRFTSHSTLLSSQFGGGGAMPYSPGIVADIIANLIHSVKHEDEKGTRYEVLRDVLLASTPVDSQGTFNHPPYIEVSFKNSLRSYLVVHDVSVEGPDLARAHQILLEIEQQYGPHCGLLVINSSSQYALQQIGTDKPAIELDNHVQYHSQYAAALNLLSTVNPFTRLTDMLAEDVLVERTAVGLIAKNPSSEMPSFRYARHLGEEDISNIRGCIRQIIIQSVIPWMEARIREWNEGYMQSRKGIAGKLFGAGKRLFGGTEHATTSSAGYDPNPSYSAAHYTIRRSADFAFMLRDYKSAMSIYEAIRQDYMNDNVLTLMPNIVV